MTLTVHHKRAPLLAPPEYKALHPQGTAPIIQDGDLTLAESGACIEYICHKHGGGKLFLPPTHPAYADFLYWWHWSNGTFMPTIWQTMSLRALNASRDSLQMTVTNSRFRKAFAALNERLRDNQWLAGSEFTVADVMVVFVLTTARYWVPYSLEEHENVVKYLKRVSEREGYQKAMKKCEPELELALGVEPPKKE